MAMFHSYVNLPEVLRYGMNQGLLIGLHGTTERLAYSKVARKPRNCRRCGDARDGMGWLLDGKMFDFTCGIEGMMLGNHSQRAAGLMWLIVFNSG